MAMVELPRERIFTRGEMVQSPLDTPSTPEEKQLYYNQRLLALITDTVDYEESYLSGERDKHVKYYYGQYPLLSADPNADQIWGDPPAYDGELDNLNTANRSTVVSTDVRDAVMTMLPSLIRIFAAQQTPVWLVPRKPMDTEMSKQATDYTNYVFWEDNDGFLILHSVFKDALCVKGGFVKWWTDDIDEWVEKTYHNVTTEQFQYLVQENPEMQVANVDGDPGSGLARSLTVRYKKSKPLIRCAAVPPEEMRLDRYANNFKASRITGHERVVPISDLTAIGIPEDYLRDNMTSSNGLGTNSDERRIRNPASDEANMVGDGVVYGEWFVNIDKDGDGVAELRYIQTIGEDRDIYDDQPAARVKFAYFSADPRPHTIIGDDVADLAIDVQRIKTNLYRGILDSLAESINPKTVVNELTTNLDDALNDDLGAVIRTRGDPNAAVAFSQTPFVGKEALPVLDSLDLLLSRRTGLSDAAKGLDPKALQSSTAIGVDAVLTGAQERIELTATILAHTGFKDLFNGLYNEICENPNQKRTLYIRGTWVDYDTSTFDHSMTVKINPTLGKTSDLMRMQTLAQIKTDQIMVIEKFGVANPMVSPIEIYNTISDQLEMANIRDPGRYFKQITPEVMQQIQSTPQEPDPMAVAAKAQFEKVRADASKAIAQQNIAQDKMAQEADQKAKDRAAAADKTDEDNATKLAIAQLQAETDRITAITKSNQSDNAN